MKYLLFASLFAAATSTGSVDVGGQTATAISVFTFSGMKSEMARNSQMTPKQKSCINKIPNDALAASYLPLLREQLDAKKLARFDTFFSSALGKRYLSAFSLSPSTAGYGAESFTEYEISTIKKVMNDSSFMSFARNTNVQNPGAPHDRSLRLLQACR